MFHRLILLLLLAGFPRHGLATEFSDALSSVNDVHTLMKDDYARNIPFCLTGLVTYVNQRLDNKTCRFLLHAPEGDCLLWSTNTFPHPGEVVRTSGFTELNSFAQEQILHATNAVVLGHARVPEPELLSLADILSGKGDYKTIRIRGFFTDVFDDDIDSKYVISLLNVGGRIIHTSTAKEPDTLARIRALIDADIELTGVCSPTIGGKRRFGGPAIQYALTPESIRVLTPPPDDPFQAPSLQLSSRQQAESFAKMKRRSVHGRVLAVWQKKNTLMTYGDGLIARLELTDGELLPKPDVWIDAVGFPQTDLFNINLSNTRVRIAPEDDPVPTSEAMPVSADRICHHPFTKRFDHDFHGRLVRLSGIVRSVPSADRLQERMAIDDKGILVPIDAGNLSDAFAGIEIGSQVEVTGICVMESENWRPQRIVPVITGFFLVIRSPLDVHVLVRPPWWTPRKLLIALVGLFLILVAILVWNLVLRKLVERRSRELVRSQAEKLEADLRVDERTRIASELHDYLAQNLTAVSYKLTSARAVRDSDPESADAQLETAANMLDSSRTELRRCLWDLKSKALEEPTFDLAIRRSLQQITSLGNIDVAFDVTRAGVSDPTAHAILSIIRELVANAVNHGLADRIAIHGEIRDGFLSITVRDNGHGFDVTRASSPDDGHFGLDGIRQRIKRLDGTFELSSAPTAGTQAAIRIPLHSSP